MKTPVWKNPLGLAELVDWGAVPTMIEGRSHTSGKLLHKGPEGRSECGLWVCTPGKWPLKIPRDEFCHFIAGRATYVGDDGETIEVRPGTCVHFPAGWTGVCTVHETIRNAYMLR